MTARVGRRTPAAVTRARELVEPALAAEVARLRDPRVRRVAGYQLGLWDVARPAGDAAAARRSGRRWCCSRPGPSAAHPEPGVPAAVAVELVHNFSLLHDDIMDRDVERRHRPTGWVAFGEGQAMLGGNAMMASAVEVLSRECPHPEATVPELLRVVQELISGQSCDLALEGDDTADLDTVLAMEQDKTAALLSGLVDAGRARRRRRSRRRRAARRGRTARRHRLPARRRRAGHRRRPRRHRQVGLVGRARRQAFGARSSQPCGRAPTPVTSWPTLLRAGAARDRRGGRARRRADRDRRRHHLGELRGRTPAQRRVRAARRPRPARPCPAARSRRPRPNCANSPAISSGVIDDATIHPARPGRNPGDDSTAATGRDECARGPAARPRPPRVAAVAGRVVEGRAAHQRDHGRRGPAAAAVPRHPARRRARAVGPLDPQRSSAPTARGPRSRAARGRSRRRSRPTRRCAWPATPPTRRTWSPRASSCWPAAASRPAACSPASGWRCSASGPGTTCRPCRPRSCCCRRGSRSTSTTGAAGRGRPSCRSPSWPRCVRCARCRSRWTSCARTARTAPRAAA